MLGEASELRAVLLSWQQPAKGCQVFNQVLWVTTRTVQTHTCTHTHFTLWDINNLTFILVRLNLHQFFSLMKLYVFLSLHWHFFLVMLKLSTFLCQEHNSRYFLWKLFLRTLKCLTANQMEIQRKAVYFPNIISHVVCSKTRSLLECVRGFEGMDVHSFALVNSYKARCSLMLLLSDRWNEWFGLRDGGLRVFIRACLETNEVN